MALDQSSLITILERRLCQTKDLALNFEISTQQMLDHMVNLEYLLTVDPLNCSCFQLTVNSAVFDRSV